MAVKQQVPWWWQRDQMLAHGVMPQWITPRVMTLAPQTKRWKKRKRLARRKRRSSGR
jgi:hypothetical protein